jgi:hypothetical protein
MAGEQAVSATLEGFCKPQGHCQYNHVSARQNANWQPHIHLPRLEVSPMSSTQIRVTAFCLLVSFCQAQAQIAAAGLEGMVSDTQGAAIPSAEIQITNNATGQSYAFQSSPNGEYLARALPPGTYTLRVRREGFKEYVRAGVVLTTNSLARIDVTLEIGPVVESISVTADASPVNVTSSSLDTLVDGKRLVDLPLNGRNILSLTQLSPGVTRTTLVIGPSSDQQRINVNGNRSYSTNVMLDGSSMANAHRGQSLMQPPPEALQEVKIITSGITAEHGRGSAIISVVTKGGTNEFHGSLWEFFRNDALDARSFFAQAVPKLRFNQYGGTLGGPVRRNRAFFFGSYQGLLSRSDSVRSSAFPPTEAERRGDFSAVAGPGPVDPLTRQPFPGGIIPRDRLDPASLRLLELFPLPNRPNGQYVAQRSTPTDGHMVMARGDYDFSPADRLSIRYMLDYPKSLNPFAAADIDTYTGSSPMNRTHNLNISHHRSFNPRVLLVTRVGITRFLFRELNTERRTLADFGSRFVTGGGPGSLPRIAISGRMTAFSALENINRKSDTEEGGADLSIFSGKHEVKFGGWFGRIRYLSHQSGRAYGEFNFNGTFTGNPMADFMLGLVPQLRQEAARLNDVSHWQYALYFQDRWKVGRRLTLQAGLRWELYQPWRAVANAFHSFVEGAQSIAFPTAPRGVLWQNDPGFPYQRDFVNIGPRFGLAWDLTGDGKTSLRGGYSATYDQLIAQVAAQNAQPFGADIIAANAGPLSDPQRNINVPYGKPLDLTNPTWALPFTFTTSFLSSDNQVGMAHNMNLTFERQVMQNTVVQASYVSNLGRKLTNGQQINPAVFIPGASTSRNIDARRIFAPTFGSIYAYSTDANSNYHSLQLVLNRRYTGGLSVQAGYAWAKALDEVGTMELAHWAAQNPKCRACDRARGDYDVRHRLVASWLYDLPFFRESRGRLGRVLSGWKLSGIGTMQAGMPFTVFSGRDNSLMGVNVPYGADRPDVVGDPRLPSDRPKAERLARWFNTSVFVQNAQGTFGNAGRNILDGPGMIVFDLSLNKKMSVTERIAADLRWDVFNAFNRANFSAPRNSLAASATFGAINSSGPGRIMQLALRLEF